MDTIIIKLDNKKVPFKILYWAQFTPEYSDNVDKRLFSDLSQHEIDRTKNKKMRYLRHFVLHPNKPKDDESYVPSVEMYETADAERHIVEYSLNIRFSVSKLLYDTSVQDPSESDSRAVYERLTERLRVIGIQVYPETLPEAHVSVVHFCKNIILPKDISFRVLLSELSRVDLGKSYETTTDILLRDKNKSEVLHFRCGTREWSIYDKVKDLQKPRNKREDKHMTALEKDLVNLYDLNETEIFRYEYRLNQAQTIKSEINAILGRDYKTQVVLKDLFSEGLWKKVLLASWQRIVERPENLFALIAKPKSKLELFMHILKKAHKNDSSVYSQNRALWSYGLAVAIINHGAKAVRTEFSKIWSDKANERFEDKLKTAVDLLDGMPISEGVMHVSKELEFFQRVTLDSLPRIVK